MGAISSVFVRKVVAAAEVDLDKIDLLRNAGVDPDAAPELAQMVSEDNYYTLLETLADAEGESPKFQINAGASMRCEDYSAFGMAWKAATTLHGSMERAERYSRLLTSVSTYTVEADEEDAYMFLHREGSRRGLLLSNEATLASITSLIREISVTPFTPRAVYLKHEAPHSTKHHEDFFGCKVIFSSDRNALLLSRKMLDQKNRLGDRAMSEFFNSILDQELSKIETDRPIEELVQMQISQSFSEGVPKMSEVARSLGMSERTLHRRLAKPGLTFQMLVEKSRQQMAEGLLQQTRYSLAEVAFMTGFSEQSAFTRAFKRWAGCTPASFRQEKQA
jgi:AraC-like DNA-binding protein